MFCKLTKRYGGLPAPRAQRLRTRLGACHDQRDFGERHGKSFHAALQAFVGDGANETATVGAIVIGLLRGGLVDPLGWKEGGRVDGFEVRDMMGSRGLSLGR